MTSITKKEAEKVYTFNNEKQAQFLAGYINSTKLLSPHLETKRLVIEGPEEGQFSVMSLGDAMYAGFVDLDEEIDRNSFFEDLKTFDKVFKENLA